MAADGYPVLYSFRRCPYAMRARMAILVSGRTVRLRELILKDKPAEMLEASPKGTVPVLILPTGEVIDESLAVMEWAASGGNGELSLPGDDARALITRNDGPFKQALDRYKYPTRYDDVDPIEHRAAGAAILADLDERISEGGQLSGDTPGFADLAIFPFVRQFRIPDAEWFDAQDWPHLHPWLQGHVTSDLFAAAMPKFPLWNDTGEEILFGAPD